MVVALIFRLAQIRTMPESVWNSSGAHRQRSIINQRFLDSGETEKQHTCYAAAPNVQVQTCRILLIAQIRGSIVVSISARHAEDPGSIPGRGVFNTC